MYNFTAYCVGPYTARAKHLDIGCKWKWTLHYLTHGCVCNNKTVTIYQKNSETMMYCLQI